MLVTAVVLYALGLGGDFALIACGKGNLAFLLLGLLNALTPLMVPLANLINKPMELGVNRHYTNEAKRMLKSCPDLQTVGITGSYGKTGVKFYL